MDNVLANAKSMPNGEQATMRRHVLRVLADRSTWLHPYLATGDIAGTWTSGIDDINVKRLATLLEVIMSCIMQSTTLILVV